METEKDEVPILSEQEAMKRESDYVSAITSHSANLRSLAMRVNYFESAMMTLMSQEYVEIIGEMRESVDSKVDKLDETAVKIWIKVCKKLNNLVEREEDNDSFFKD